MHPAVIEWWHARQRATSCGEWAGCAPAEGRGTWGRGPRTDFGDADGGDGGNGGGPFGVRRPLRFIAYKLDLSDKQVAELARVLDELKTERAQAEVDRRRTVAALADAVAGETFDTGKAGEGAKLRVASAERLRDAVIKALQQIHAMLDPDQREKLAYLIRTGALLI
jgi:Spy/CpxP family protein refolding chaperone